MCCCTRSHVPPGKPRQHETHRENLNQGCVSDNHAIWHPDTQAAVLRSLRLRDLSSISEFRTVSAERARLEPFASVDFYIGIG